MNRKTHQLPIFNFIRKSYWQLLKGVMGNVKSGWGCFTQTFNCHVPCKEVKLQKKCNT